MAGVVQSFRAGDLTTAEWMSKRSGTDTATAQGFNQGWGQSSGGTNNNTGMSYQQIQVPFIQPDSMFGFRDGYMLGWLAGQKYPLPLFAPFYDAVSSLRERALPNPYFRG